MTDEVHEHGAACMIQLTHLGRRTGWAQDDWLPVVAPSPLREPAHRAIPKEAEDWDIERIVGKYADAAERMQAGGMDGIEIESYGHLFDQFWSPLTNHRTDEYGGSFENRLRFGWQVLRRHPGAGRRRLHRRDPHGRRRARRRAASTPPTGLDDPRAGWRPTAWSTSSTSSAATSPATPSSSRSSRSTACRRRPTSTSPGRSAPATGLAVLHASKVDDVATARHAIREGKVDLVGMTRAHLADPHLVRKIVEGREAEIRPCVGATYCLDRIYEAGEALCIHNAATSREQTMPHVIPPGADAAPRRRRRRRAGGLEAARVAGERGHDVTRARGDAVGRRPDPPGGPQPPPARPAGHRRVAGDRAGAARGRRALRHAGRRRRRRWRCEPDVVIVATGGLPQLPELEDGGDRMVTSWDVLGGDVTPTGDVLFYDDNGTHSAHVGGRDDRPLGRPPGDRDARSGCSASRWAA